MDSGLLAWRLSSPTPLSLPPQETSSQQEESLSYTQSQIDHAQIHQYIDTIASAQLANDHYQRLYQIISCHFNAATSSTTISGSTTAPLIGQPVAPPPPAS
ncbi:unnamed protein product [Rotaria sp. Silwood2]|nr:unnamed protein product [Rotaria sp. Silwood2]